MMQHGFGNKYKIALIHRIDPVFDEIRSLSFEQIIDLVLVVDDSDSLWSLSGDELLWKHCNARLLKEEDVLFLESLPESVPFLLDSIGYSLQHLYSGYETIVSLPQ